MHIAKEQALSILRNKNSGRPAFQKAAYTLANILAQEAADKCQTKSVQIETPLGVAQSPVFVRSMVLVPILRSGITMVPAFLRYFPDARIGVVGLKRDEKTHQAHWYYNHLPTLDGSEQIIILDPMIATGGTATQTIAMIKEQGIPENQIMFVAVISAPDGVNLIKKQFPDVTLIIAAQDPKLSPEKFIVPGLGDYGDRFFGTEI